MRNRLRKTVSLLLHRGEMLPPQEGKRFVAGQGFERREILRVLSMAAAAGQFGVFEHWAFACPEHPDNALLAGPAAPFQSKFFTSEEYFTLQILCDLIIPSDGRPGAKEAGVSEFVDFMASSDPSIQFQFRYGLGWLNGHAEYLFKKSFSALPQERQIEILEHLAYKDKQRDGEEGGREFFALLREYTVMGFYTSRIGLQEIGYPGLKQMWNHDPMGCSHADDREHKNLRPVRG